MPDDVQLTAKLVLDTKDAEKQLSGMSAKPQAVTLPKGTEIELPKETTKGLKGLFTGDKGLKDVGRIARGATGGIQSMLGSLGNLTSVGSMAAAVVGAVAAAVMLIVKLLQGTDTWEYIGAAIESLIDMLRDGLAPALTMLGEVVVSVIDLLKPLMPLVEAIGNGLAMLLTPLVYALKLLKPLMDIVGKLLELSNAISNVLGDTLMGIMNSLMQIILQLTSSALKPLLDLLDKAIEFFEKLETKIQDFITNLTKGAIRFDRKTLAATTGSKQDKIRTSLDTWQTTEGETAAEKQARLAAEAAEDAAESARGFRALLEAAGAKIADWGAKIGEGAKEAWGKITGFAKGMWADAGKWASAAWDNVKTWWVNLIDKIREMLHLDGEFLQGVAESTQEYVQEVVEGTKSFFSGIADKAKSIGEGIASGAKNVFGKVRGFLGFADGGTIGGAQVWGMNERGNPEFIFNAGGHDTVINKDILAEAMYEALRRSNNEGKQTIEVAVKDGTPVGARELANMLLPSLKFLLAR